MLGGLVSAIVAGALVGIQNIFNSKVNEQANYLATTTLVLGLGFVASLAMGLFFEGKQLFALEQMRTWHWFSGLLGVGVVICLVQAIKQLGPTYAISIILTSQLFFALLFDVLGWFGLEQVPFTFTQLAGVLIIVAGILLFKLGGEREQIHHTERKEESKQGIHKVNV